MKISGGKIAIFLILQILESGNLQDYIVKTIKVGVEAKKETIKLKFLVL